MFGHEVHFAFAPMEDGDREEMSRFFGDERLHISSYRPPPALASKSAALWRRVRRRLGMASGHTYKIDDWYDPALDSFYRSLADSTHFDVVIAEYAFLSKALTCFGSSTMKIIDTHDRFADRHMMFLAARLPAGWFSTSYSEELKGLRRADVIIAIESGEREYFARRLPERTVITVGHIAGESAPITNWNERLESTILMVGASNPPNLGGLRYILGNVLPRVHARHPKARLLLAGGICTSVPDSPLVQKLGYVKNIDEVYAKAWIALNPVQSGSGQSIKAVEALGHSLPLVTTVTGARGLPESALPAFIKVQDTDPGAMANALVSLLSNASERTALSRAASLYIRDYNKGALASLLNVLSNLGKPRAANELGKIP